MKIAVVIPAYKAKKTIMDVLKGIPTFIDKIYVIDDQCPEETGKFVDSVCTDSRVLTIYHEENKGIGGATITGYKKAIADDIDIVVKINSNGQMDPALLPSFIKPIIDRKADYTKGNRFYDLRKVSKLPKLRIFANAGVSFLTRLSSGYWNIFDPTNGYTAIHKTTLNSIDLDDVSSRFFFESDLLFYLYLSRAVVADIPVHSKYGNEENNLNPLSTFFELLGKNLKNFFKRVCSTYLVRDFNIASLELFLGVVLFLLGILFGGYKWIADSGSDTVATSGEVMLVALPIILGSQLILSFLNYDSQNFPKVPFSKK